MGNARSDDPSPYPWPWLTDVSFLRRPGWRRFVLKLRHLLAVAVLLPKLDLFRVWRIVAKSKLWNQFYNVNEIRPEGRLVIGPAGRCLLKVSVVDSAMIAEWEERRRAWDEAELHLSTSESDQLAWFSNTRQIDSIIALCQNERSLCVVQIFMNTISRVGEIPWRSYAFVDLASGEIVTQFATLGNAMPGPASSLSSQSAII